jgi:hypothetical protein
MELVEKKRRLIQNFGYRVVREDGVWIVYEPSLRRGHFYYENAKYEETIEVGFRHVSGMIIDGLLNNSLSVEAASRYFRNTDDPPSILTSR